MPQARPGRRGDAADRLDRAPYRAAGGLDAQARPVTLAAQPGLGDAQMRQIERAQRIKLRHREAGAEILANLAHRGGNRAAPLHDHQRIDRTIRLAGMAGGIGDRLREPLDAALPLAFRGRAQIRSGRRGGFGGGAFRHDCS